MHMYCKHFYGGNGIVGAQVRYPNSLAYVALGSAFQNPE